MCRAGIQLPACKISKQLDNFKNFDQIDLLYLNGGVYNSIITKYIHINTVQIH